MSSQTEKQSDIAVAEEQEIREPSNYNIIVHNNDYTSYEEVIIILTQSFAMSHDEALAVANTVNNEGRGICGTFSKEIAEMKLILIDTLKEQLSQMFPHRSREIKMLKFTIEKA